MRFLSLAISTRALLGVAGSAESLEVGECVSAALATWNHMVWAYQIEKRPLNRFVHTREQISRLPIPIDGYDRYASRPESTVLAGKVIAKKHSTAQLAITFVSVIERVCSRCGRISHTITGPFGGLRPRECVCALNRGRCICIGHYTTRPPHASHSITRTTAFSSLASLTLLVLTMSPHTCRSSQPSPMRMRPSWMLLMRLSRSRA